jgi:type II secretory pathway pseudopilin PulG
VNPFSHLRHRSAAEHGFGIIEAVMAAAIFLIFAGAAFAMLTDAQKRSANAERHEAAISLAQREIERLRQFGYADLGLTGSPTAAAAGSSTNPDNPAEYVSGSNLRVKSDFRDRNSAPPPGVAATGEPFVIAATTGVSPAPVRMSSSGYQYDVHRFVTWVDLTCVESGTDRCNRDADNDGVEDPDAKRLTVAVRPIAEQQKMAGTKPVWVTTVLTDPTSVSATATPPTAPADPTATSQAFYLYDTRCDSDVRLDLTAGHAARDTGRSGNVSCAATNDGRPDLMGPVRAPGTETATMFNYSTDYPFVRTEAELAPGLGLLPPLPASPSCPTSYLLATAAIDRHRVHRWVTRPMTAAFTATAATPRSSLTYWTRTVDQLAGSGEICLALHKLSSTGAATALATGRHKLSVWPTEAYQAQFIFDHLSATGFTVAAGERLMLTLSLTNDTLPGGVELLYDHPQYDTVLQVGTTTPLP